MEPVVDTLIERDGIYVCKTCSTEFFDESQAETHIMQFHNLHTFACLKCPDKFQSLRALFCHMEQHPEENGRIPCPMCQFSTDKKSKLLNHMSGTHRSLNECEECGKTFNSRTNFRKHLLRHDENNKTLCIVCSNKYFSEKALLRHQICMHRADIVRDPQELWCDICRMEFKTINLLKYHIEKAHTKQVRSVIKKCLCDICGQGFKDVDNLKKHKISHTEIRPFNCTECGKSFKHKYVLTYHQRIHTGERPYVCGYCTKTFRQWTPYKVHLRGHTGEKPYVCKLCSKGFTTNQALKQHIKSCFDSNPD